MTTRFIADLHFNHKKIHEMSGPKRGDVTSMEEHDQWIIDQWNSVVTKHDVTWVLGDVSFTRSGIQLVKKLNGTKHLILGNHDTFALKHYNEVFNKIHGFMKYRGFWISHAPIASFELRGKVNIHGHTHGDQIFHAPGYRCVSVESLNGKPIDFEELKLKGQGK